MFERAIFSLLTDGIAELTAGTTSGAQPTLRRLLGGVAYEDAEIDTLVEFWNSEEGLPVVKHGYPRMGAKLPCYAIILSREQEDRHYLGDHAGEYEQCAVDFIAEVEAELGRPVTARLTRFNLTYSIYVYAESPDVTQAYYNVLRSIFLAKDKSLLGLGLNELEFSGMDLAPDPSYLQDNVFTRVFQVQGWAHVLYSNDLDLGPLGLARGKTISRVHVASQVLGVDPGVSTYTPPDEA